MKIEKYEMLSKFALESTHWKKFSDLCIKITGSIPQLIKDEELEKLYDHCENIKMASVDVEGRNLPQPYVYLYNGMGRFKLTHYENFIDDEEGLNLFFNSDENAHRWSLSLLLCYESPPSVFESFDIIL